MFVVGAALAGVRPLFGGWIRAWDAGCEELVVGLLEEVQGASEGDFFCTEDG